MQRKNTLPANGCALHVDTHPREPFHAPFRSTSMGRNAWTVCCAISWRALYRRRRDYLKFSIPSRISRCAASTPCQPPTLTHLPFFKRFVMGKEELNLFF